MQNKNNIMIKLNIILFSINRREAAAAPSKLLFFYLVVVVKLVMILELKKESQSHGPGQLKKINVNLLLFLLFIRSIRSIQFYFWLFDLCCYFLLVWFVLMFCC